MSPPWTTGAHAWHGRPRPSPVPCFHRLLPVLESQEQLHLQDPGGQKAPRDDGDLVHHLQGPRVVLLCHVVRCLEGPKRRVSIVAHEGRWGCRWLHRTGAEADTWAPSEQSRSTVVLGSRAGKARAPGGQPSPRQARASARPREGGERGWPGACQSQNRPLHVPFAFLQLIAENCSRAQGGEGVWATSSTQAAGQPPASGARRRCWGRRGQCS